MSALRRASEGLGLRGQGAVAGGVGGAAQPVLHLRQAIEQRFGLGKQMPGRGEVGRARRALVTAREEISAGKLAGAVMFVLFERPFMQRDWPAKLREKFRRPKHSRL